MGFGHDVDYFYICKNATPDKNACVTAANEVKFEGPVYSTDIASLCDKENSYMVECIHAVTNIGIANRDLGIYKTLCHRPEENTASCYRQVKKSNYSHIGAYKQLCL